MCQARSARQREARPHPRAVARSGLPRCDTPRRRAHPAPLERTAEGARLALPPALRARDLRFARQRLGRRRRRIERHVLRLEPCARRREAREQLAHELLAVAHLHAPVREAAPVAQPLDGELDLPIHRHAAQEVGVEGVERALGGERGGERRAAERHAAEAVEPRVEAVAGDALELEYLVERARPRSLHAKPPARAAAYRASVRA